MKTSIFLVLMLICTPLLFAPPAPLPPLPVDRDTPTPTVTTLERTGIVGEFEISVTDQQQKPPSESGGIETTINLSIRYVGPTYGNPGTTLEFFAVGSKELVYDLLSFACDGSNDNFDQRLFTDGTLAGSVCFVVHPDDADVLSLGVSRMNGEEETLWLATTDESVSIAPKLSKPVLVSMHDDFSFAPDAITIPANTDVTISVVNEGFAQHDFVIVGTGYRTELLNNAQTATLIVNLPPGTYEVICSVPGHAQSGMVAALLVQNEGEASTPATSDSIVPNVVVDVTTQDSFSFEPNRLTIPANTDVAIRITNDGFAQHGFVIVDTGYEIELLSNGESADLVVNLLPGEYTFICPVPGHQPSGMVGTLIVN